MRMCGGGTGVIDSSVRTTSAGDSGSKSPGELIGQLRRRLRKPGVDWRMVLLEAVGEWPLASEEFGDDTLVYLVGGEAFNWQLLAHRLMVGAGVPAPSDEWNAWMDNPEPFAGLEEQQFMRLLGVDKFRAHLSYFYGVTVEQALIVAVEEEITKGRVANGREPTDRAREEAYRRLYSDEQDALWDAFREDNDVPPARPGYRHRDEHTLSDSDAFTYWLFKRRLKNSVPARVASDTRKGLAQLERMRQAHERRRRMMRGLEDVL